MPPQRHTASKSSRRNTAGRGREATGAQPARGAPFGRYCSKVAGQWDAGRRSGKMCARQRPVGSATRPRGSRRQPIASTSAKTPRGLHQSRGITAENGGNLPLSGVPCPCCVGGHLPARRPECDYKPHATLEQSAACRLGQPTTDYGPAIGPNRRPTPSSRRVGHTESCSRWQRQSDPRSTSQTPLTTLDGRCHAHRPRATTIYLLPALT